VDLRSIGKTAGHLKTFSLHLKRIAGHRGEIAEDLKTISRDPKTIVEDPETIAGHRKGIAEDLNAFAEHGRTISSHVRRIAENPTTHHRHPRAKLPAVKLRGAKMARLRATPRTVLAERHPPPQIEFQLPITRNAKSLSEEDYGAQASSLHRSGQDARAPYRITSCDKSLR